METGNLEVAIIDAGKPGMRACRDVAQAKDSALPIEGASGAARGPSTSRIFWHGLASLA